MTELLVLSNVGSKEEAEMIARVIVEEKLAACVNISSQVRSIYKWEGKLCEENEFTMFIKTNSEKYEGLKKRFVELHSYEVPEFISFEIKDGLDSYIRWLNESLKNQ